jgi:hypothetical protein
MAHQQASQRHGQQPARQAVKRAFPDKQPVDAAGGCSHRPQDGQLAAPGGRIHGHQAVDQEHAHEKRRKTQEGQIDLVGPDHALPAGFDGPGRADLKIGADEGRRFGGEIGITVGQAQVDAIDLAESPRKLLESGDVAQGDSPVGHGTQTLRRYPPPRR